MFLFDKVTNSDHVVEVLRHLVLSDVCACLCPRLVLDVRPELRAQREAEVGAPDVKILEKAPAERLAGTGEYRTPHGRVVLVPDAELRAHTSAHHAAHVNRD